MLFVSTAAEIECVRRFHISLNRRAVRIRDIRSMGESISSMMHRRISLGRLVKVGDLRYVLSDISIRIRAAAMPFMRLAGVA